MLIFLTLQNKKCYLVVLNEYLKNLLNIHHSPLIIILNALILKNVIVEVDFLKILLADYPPKFDIFKYKLHFSHS